MDWVGNFNLLLHQSRGRYFVCMAHDDSFPSVFIGELVSVLEAHPDAVFAFGKVEQVSVDGFLPTFPSTPPPISGPDNWTFGCSLRLLTLWQLWIAYRGMVRRDVVERDGLYMRHSYRNIRADVYSGVRPVAARTSVLRAVVLVYKALLQIEHGSRMAIWNLPES